MTGTFNRRLTAVGRLAFFIVTIGLALPCQMASAQKAANSACGSHTGAIDVTDFGAKGDGSTDNLESFKAALAYASRCSVPTVHVPAGTYALVPAGAVGGLLLPSNITLVGDGIGKTVLQVASGKAGANFDSLLWARNQDNIEIRGMTMLGNNVVVNNASGQPLNTYGTAISIALDEKPAGQAYGTPRDLKGFTIADCQFENFNGAAWVRVTNYHASYVISNIEIRHNMFRSHPGNAVNPSNIGFTSFAIQVTGSRNSAAGLVKGVRIHGNNIEATHIKGGVGIYAGVADAVIAENTIVNAGASDSIPDDRGAYAISVYQNAYKYDQGQAVMLGGAAPDDVHIERNVITRPRSCGIYTAAVNRIWVVGNKVSGQSDGNNKTLPKGAIVMNHPTEGTVTDNQLSSNHIGMSVLTDEKGRVAASNNSISDVPRGGVATIAPGAH